jgi:hypothetical protein
MRSSLQNGPGTIPQGRIVIVPALVAAAVLTSAGPAAAERAPPSPWAAVAQYVEMIPTSTGPRAAGAAGPTKPLPASLAKELGRSAGPDANALATLVTSSGWDARPIEGAPEPASGACGRPSASLAVPSPQESTSLAASVGGGLTSGPRAAFAVVALLCLLAASILLRLRRTRSSR